MQDPRGQPGEVSPTTCPKNLLQEWSAFAHLSFSLPHAHAGNTFLACPGMLGLGKEPLGDWVSVMESESSHPAPEATHLQNTQGGYVWGAEGEWNALWSARGFA